MTDTRILEIDNKLSRAKLCNFKRTEINIKRLKMFNPKCQTMDRNLKVCHKMSIHIISYQFKECVILPTLKFYSTKQDL